MDHTTAITKRHTYTQNCLTYCICLNLETKFEFESRQSVKFEMRILLMQTRILMILLPDRKQNKNDPHESIDDVDYCTTVLIDACIIVLSL